MISAMYTRNYRTVLLEVSDAKGSQAQIQQVTVSPYNENDAETIAEALKLSTVCAAEGQTLRFSDITNMPFRIYAAPPAVNASVWGKIDTIEGCGVWAYTDTDGRVVYNVTSDSDTPPTGKAGYYNVNEILNRKGL